MRVSAAFVSPLADFNCSDTGTNWNSKPALTRTEASRELFQFIEIWYNRQRRHSTLGYRTPMEFEEQVVRAD